MKRNTDEMTFGEAMLFLKVSNTMLRRLVDTGSMPCTRTIVFGMTKYRFSRMDVTKALTDGKLAGIHIKKGHRKPRQSKATTPNT